MHTGGEMTFYVNLLPRGPSIFLSSAREHGLCVWLSSPVLYSRLYIVSLPTLCVLLSLTLQQQVKSKDPTKHGQPVNSESIECDRLPKMLPVLWWFRESKLDDNPCVVVVSTNCCWLPHTKCYYDLAYHGHCNCIVRRSYTIKHGWRHGG